MHCPVARAGSSSRQRSAGDVSAALPSAQPPLGSPRPRAADGRRQQPWVRWDYSEARWAARRDCSACRRMACTSRPGAPPLVLTPPKLPHWALQTALQTPCRRPLAAGCPGRPWRRRAAPRHGRGRGSRPRFAGGGSAMLNLRHPCVAGGCGDAMRCSMILGRFVLRCVAERQGVGATTTATTTAQHATRSTRQQPRHATGSSRWLSCSRPRIVGPRPHTHSPRPRILIAHAFTLPHSLRPTATNSL